MSTPKLTLQEDAPASEPSSQRRFQPLGSDRVWVVDSGYADLFSIAVDSQGEPDGAFHHLLRLGEGQAIFGIDPDAAVPITLIASAGPQTKISSWSFSQYRRKALAMQHDQQLIRTAEDWIVNLSMAAARQVAPKKFRTISSGETLTTADEAEPVLAAANVCWIEHKAGSSRVLAMEEFTLGEQAPPFPVSRFFWIEAQPDTSLAASDSLWLLETGVFHEGLKAFHTQAIACIARNLHDAEEKERDQVVRRAAADAKALRAAVSELASPLGGFRDEIAVSRHILDTPLFLACQAIGKAAGIEFKPHPDMLQGKKVSDPVGALARASGIRTRVVALKGPWWRDGGQPLLVFDEKDKRAMALIPQGSRGYLLYDPTHERTGRFKPDSVSLNPFAYTFYRPFPQQALSAKDLVAFGLKGCRPEAFRVVLMGAASGLLATVTPLATQVIFDSLIPGARRSELLLTCGFLVVAAVASALFTLTRGFAVLRMEGRMSASTQAAVWDRVLGLPVSFFRDYAAGDLAARSMAIAQMRQILTGNTLSSILSGIFSIFSFVLLFYYSAKLALMYTALTGVAAAVTFASGYFQLQLQRQSWARSGYISGMVLEFITGITKFRVAGAENRAFALWVREFAQQKKTDFSANKLANALTVFNAVYPALSLSTIFLYYSYTKGDVVNALSTGQFLAFVAASTQFLMGVLSLSSSAVSLLKIVPMYERAAPILRTLPETDAARSDPGELTGALEASHLIFRYRPDAPIVLRDVSFTIAPGEFVAFVGPSGCGKSTLFRLLLGFEAPESGAIYFDGQDLSGLDLQSVRRQIGVVLQSGSLVTGTILENIRGSNSSLTVDSAWDAIRQAGLAEDVQRLPMGIHTYIREAGGGLSGGQRQRMLIARAIIGKPRILLFDEATSALDNRTQSIVSSSLKALKSTRIVIAHRLSTIADADRIMVMDKGRIVQRGTYAELMQEGGLFRELANRQLV